ncbi:cation:proton antiporter [Actinoplanes couchii]|uniref:Sodium/hydrogen exchanger n=1 Tax=Actinoplanes couchii TaxID=403638 RepID=A0ABQ3XQZ4_9ACTN|nr:cation:proton antiporter [Actinoplanes couchii]MDR6318860.1 NhaP-type Na+/H+ or K+/H+ antiporter [Actinoplanes couchii]GID60890.1 sodium/hydrogen exchanger [Actinoplanes couchii]
MKTVLVVLLTATMIAMIFARVLRRYHLQAPIVLVAAGIATGHLTHFQMADALNTQTAQHAAEVILAVLLFVDATRVRRGRLWGDDPGTVARLLFIALPLSLVAAVGAGLLLAPGLPWAALLVIACVIMPIDLAPATWIIGDRRLPMRVRAPLNIEGGYNDGIVSPIFLFALAAVGAAGTDRDPLDALATAVPSSATAVAVGAVIGAVAAMALHQARRREWAEQSSARIVLVLVPLLTYLAAVSVDGNGFVASFVSGIMFRAIHERAGAGQAVPGWQTDFPLVADFAQLLSFAMWFVFGNVAFLVVMLGVDWRMVILALLALTVLRLGPVLLATMRSRFTWSERAQMGLLGPRGTTTIVFGLLAFNELPDGDLADMALVVMSLTVLGSVLLHNLAAVLLRARTPATTPPATADLSTAA